MVNACGRKSSAHLVHQPFVPMLSNLGQAECASVCSVHGVAATCSADMSVCLWKLHECFKARQRPVWRLRFTTVIYNMQFMDVGGCAALLVSQYTLAIVPVRAPHLAAVVRLWTGGSFCYYTRSMIASGNLLVLRHVGHPSATVYAVQSLARVSALFRLVLIHRARWRCFDCAPLQMASKLFLTVEARVREIRDREIRDREDTESHSSTMLVEVDLLQEIVVAKSVWPRAYYTLLQIVGDGSVFRVFDRNTRCCKQVSVSGHEVLLFQGTFSTRSLHFLTAEALDCVEATYSSGLDDTECKYSLRMFEPRLFGMLLSRFSWAQACAL